jgi:hypothetical protein
MNDGADDRLELDTLATARLQFAALADELPDCPHRDALRLATRIIDSLSSLRCRVSECILIPVLEDFSGPYGSAYAVRELRRALEETARAP